MTSTSKPSRQTRWQQFRALCVLSLDAKPGASFDAALAAVRKRWPVSTAGPAFEQAARELWQRELDAAAEAEATPKTSTKPPKRLAAIRRMADQEPTP